MRHHYVPQFHLSRWQNADGKLFVFTRENGRLAVGERTPKYTGYEDGLYAVPPNALGFEDADVIEKKFFSPVDNNAARVLEKMERRQPISEDDHIAWTFYLSSLRMRQPDVLNELRTNGMKFLNEKLAERDALTLAPGAATTQQWFDALFPGAMEAMSLTAWLPKIILNDGALNTFGGLTWEVREFPEATPKLLLSALPLHWEGAWAGDDFMITLPISPRRLFLGTQSQRTAQRIDRIVDADLVRRVNRTSLAASAGRIWASDKDEALRFIRDNADAIGANAIGFGSIMPWSSSTSNP